MLPQQHSDRGGRDRPGATWDHSVLGSPFAAPVDVWLPRVGGAGVVVAGLYQFTPLKNVCLKACRSPLGFVTSRSTSAAAAQQPHEPARPHGLYCLGCCWAIMAVLSVLGLMNLAWMDVPLEIAASPKWIRHGHG